VERKEARRTAERERQAGEILEVAAHSFASRGYGGASMNDIATAAGYSVGHIYNVVGNKESLFAAVLVRGAAELTRDVDATLARRQPGAADACIDELIVTILRFFDLHRSFFQIYLNETGGMRVNVERRFPEGITQAKHDLDARVRALFARARREGHTADLSANDMLTAFSELINGFVAAWAAGGYRGRIADKSRVIRHLLWKGIRA
jgi:AcrR family transcriptional regulator